jgi:putative PIN family toxin of toxin-antitoxin system
MRIVLDTNVLMSGIFFAGPPCEILQSWRQSKIKIVLSAPILSEYQRVAERLSARYPSVDIDPIIRLLAIFGELVDASGISETICNDRDDNKFIECAIAGQCKLIVSGDKHLLNLSGYKGVMVLTPRGFVDAYLKV